MEKFEYVFFGSFEGNDYTDYGNRAEKSCILALRRKYPSLLSNNGIFIHHLYPWFGYSCDGYIPDCNLLIEIKSPVIGERIPAEEFNATNCKFLTLCDENLQLKRKHKFYGQIQLGLFLLGLTASKLIVYSEFSDSFLELNVPYDEEFCSNFIPALTNVYFTKYLKFLAERKQAHLNALRMHH